MRFENLARQSLSAAELEAVRLGTATPDELPELLRPLSGAVPLPYALTHFAARYGLHEEPLRLPAAAAGVLAVLLAMLLVRDLFGVRPALAAGLLLAAAPLHAEVSRQALPASVATTATLLFAWLLWRLLRGDRVLWPALAAGGVALYSSYATLTLIGAAVGTAAAGRSGGAVSRKAARRALLASGGALLLFLPWAIADLPTEPGPEIASRTVAWSSIVALPHTAVFGEAIDGRPTGAAVAVMPRASLMLLLLATAGAAWALRRRTLAAGYALGVLALAVGAAVTTARLGPYEFSALQLLFVLPLYLGLAGAGLEAMASVLPAPALRTLACLVAAAIFAWWVERPALVSQRESTTQDWRGAFATMLQNLGPHDRVAVPLADGAVAVYGAELGGRLPVRSHLPAANAWLTRVEAGWLIAGWSARLHPLWPKIRRALDDVFAVNLSPAREPALLYIGKERYPTYLAACHFELPAAVLARQTILRDCLREIGALEGPLRHVRTLSASAGVSLRNPALLESVTLLIEADRIEEAIALAEAVALREGDWLPAQQALAAVRERRDQRR